MLVRPPVVSGRLAEPGAVLLMDHSYWKHPTLEIHTKGALLVDMASPPWFESGRHLLVQRAWETSHPWKQERYFKSVGSSITSVRWR